MSYGPGNNALITNQLPPTGDTVEEAINKLDAQLEELYTALNADAATVYSQYRGAWSSSTTYKCNDVVTSGSDTYICKDVGGAPAGSALSNTTYWQKIAISSIQFATATELSAGTVTNKAIAPSALKSKLTEINTLISTLEGRTGTLESKVDGGLVYNSDLLDGQHGSYYRCSNNCSWTCSSACSGGCGNGCTGSCLAACTGGCSSCTGSCTGSCSGCSTTCTGTCTGTCSGCSTTCTGTCKTTCTSCSGCRNNG